MSPWRPTALLSLQVVPSAPPTPLGTQRTAGRRARPSIGPERSPRRRRHSDHTSRPCAARSPHRSVSGAAPAAEPQLGSDFPRAPRPTREILARPEIGTPPAARPATGESATRVPAAGPSGGPAVALSWFHLPSCLHLSWSSPIVVRPALSPSASLRTNSARGSAKHLPPLCSDKARFFPFAEPALSAVEGPALEVRSGPKGSE